MEEKNLIEMDVPGIIKRLAAEKCGEDYLLRQLAEECAELAQAALKVIRTRHGETPVTPEEARGKLLEEIADVMVMMDLVIDSDDEVDVINRTANDKVMRMLHRLAAMKKDEQER